MEAFIGEGIIKFYDTFQSDLDCLKYLADCKAKKTYTCCKCGHDRFTVRKKNFATDCNRCHHIESPTAGTMFHKVKFGIRKAFAIVFEMSATTKGISALQISKRFEISYPAAWLFSHKVRNAMASSASQPMTGTVIVDEFVFGGKEELKQGRSTDSKKKKIVAAVELTDAGGIKRVYFEKIENYSSQSLEKIFEKHISRAAKIQTDKWTGYKPLALKYDITQIKSDKGKTFFEMNTVVHQVKAWLRSTFSWMHKEHIMEYLNEFSYRINRSIYKQNIFDLLINRMTCTKPLTYREIKISN